MTATRENPWHAPVYTRVKLPLPAPSTAASGPAAQAGPAPETSELIDVVDAHGTVVWANGARSAALGYADGALSGVPARPLGAADRAGRITLAKLPLAARFERLEAENALLRKIDDTGNETHWRIEFADPIDVALPVDEIVFHVFSNPSYWRLCN